MYQLTESDQQFLLLTARNSVRSYLMGETPRPTEPAAGVLTEPRGIFVSIHKGGELRGCIGNVHPGGPLYRSACECAIAAAVGDPRFMPMMAAELPFVEFEISVLSPIERVENTSEIQIGIHGLIISKGSLRGLLLPQVASAYGWDCEKFLQETCIKAGLRPSDWKDGATIHCFSALVFSERQFHSIAAT
jgi:hypothetical protein